MSSRVEDLIPAVQVMCRALAAMAAASGVPVNVVQTLRTWDEQDKIYTEGRTTPGEPCWHREGRRPVGTCRQHPLGVPVTRARAGFSWHNFGRAFDVALRSEVGSSMWPDADDPRWDTLGKIGESIGLEWGGRWKPPDSGHFQFRSGLTLFTARQEYVPPPQQA